MKRLLFFWTLLSLLCFSLFSTSCKKDEDEAYDIQVEISNYRHEVVYLYVNGNFRYMVSAETVSNSVISTNNGDPVNFEIRRSDGQVLHSKTVTKGESYIVVVNPEKTNSDTSDGSNSSDNSEVSEKKDVWSFAIEIHNYSSTPIHVFINGKDEKVIASEYYWVTSYNNVVNQTSVSVVVKTSDGKVLDSKSVKKGDSYVADIKDPTFTINKIVLTKWRADNLFDKPDPWFEILNGSESMGHTKYFSDCVDGEQLTWSNLNITIKNIYNKVTFKLFDYDFGYSSAGSASIGGIVGNDFSSEWGKTSFEWTTSSMAITVYGTWN